MSVETKFSPKDQTDIVDSSSQDPVHIRLENIYGRLTKEMRTPSDCFLACLTAALQYWSIEDLAVEAITEIAIKKGLEYTNTGTIVNYKTAPVLKSVISELFPSNGPGNDPEVQVDGLYVRSSNELDELKAKLAQGLLAIASDQNHFVLFIPDELLMQDNKILVMNPKQSNSTLEIWDLQKIYQAFGPVGQEFTNAQPVILIGSKPAQNSQASPAVPPAQVFKPMNTRSQEDRVFRPKN